MIFGIFGGCYSDWYIDGYFENREDAEQYIVQSNNDELYIEEIEHLTKPKKNVEILYHHEVLFRRGAMTNEPYRYDIYTGKKRKTSFVMSTFSGINEWFSVKITAKTRDIAEKIAQDYYAEYKSLYVEYGRECALKMMNESHS